MEYDFELEKAIKTIKESKSRLILLQLPDGLKPKAREIQAKLKQSTDAKILIWAGTCFGACDVPTEAERLGVDLIIQWGHSAWKAN